MNPSTLVVGDREYRYYDSGPPQGSSQYTTIFAIHGFSFSGSVFQRVISLAPASGLRFIAINRRNYPGSTPFSERDVGLLTDGSDEEKEKFLASLGLDIIAIIEKFTAQHSLPSLSKDGKSGGIAILGWSLGNITSAAAVANLDAPSATRVASQIKAYILLEPPSVAFGLPLPEKYWLPASDTSIPEEARIPMFAQWVTSYFKHQEGYLQSRSFDSLEYVVPATFRVPSIFHMSASEVEAIVTPGSALGDVLTFSLLVSQLGKSYQKACFDPSVRKAAPFLKLWHIVGEFGPHFALAAFWQVQDDNHARGGGFVEDMIMPGVNHFMHWDEPELTLRTFNDILSK